MARPGERALALTALAWTMMMGGCASPELPAPARAAQRPELFEAVPYPPPPARVELVPDSPGPRAVWIDGEWLWNGRRWAWKEGSWVVPPPAYRFARWAVVFRSDGTVLYAQGVWRNPAGKFVDELPPSDVGRAREGSVTRPEGQLEKTAPNVRPRTRPSAP